MNYVETLFGLSGKTVVITGGAGTLYIKVKQMLESVELGKVHRINWIATKHFRTQAYYDSGHWRGTWKGEGGGLLLNQCHHQLDLLQWLFGMPQKVTARLMFGKYHAIEVEDEVSAFLEYPKGTQGFSLPPQERLREPTVWKLPPKRQTRS